MSVLADALQSRPTWLRYALDAAKLSHADQIIEYTEGEFVDHVRECLVASIKLPPCMFNTVIDELESLHSND